MWRRRHGGAWVWNSFYRRGADGEWTAWLEPLDGTGDGPSVLVTAPDADGARRALTEDVGRFLRDPDGAAFRDRHARFCEPAELPDEEWPPAGAAYSTLHATPRHAALATAWTVAPAADVAVSLRHVWKNYGRVEALRGVSLDIRRGEVVAVLGPNGAGKSTAVNLMVGISQPTRGRVTLLGHRPGSLPARSRFGVMLQECGLPGTLRVQEMVDMFRSYYPSPMPRAEVLDIAGITHKARSLVSRMSRGERQRLFFALALCGDPDVLFLDEPTASLDVEARQAFLTSVRAFAGLGKTIVMTTHYLEEAEAVAERIVVFNRGRVIADSTPDEIKAGFGKRRVSFVVPGGPGDAIFAGLPVTRFERTGDRVRFLADDPEDVLRALFDRGVEVRRLEVAAAGLQEVFLALVDTSADDEPAIA
jgi:ABC-2 type transport system ATP-binding protein